MTTCPVPGCATPDRPGMLMCREHWFKASSAARRAVNKTWREYKAAKGEPPEARLLALKVYRTARDQAIGEASRGALI
jgi:hypothetical protein